MPAADALAQLLAQLFDSTFAAGYLVHMRGAAVEPLYLPATAEQPAQLVYSHDYPSSVLHEAAHWCLAGKRRRLEVDFGFTYVPSAARTVQDQLAFEAAEVRTQAIEWRLSLAAGVAFHLSVDSIERDREQLLGAVSAEVQRRLCEGWPIRVQRFALVLADALGGVAQPTWCDFAKGLADV